MKFTVLFLALLAACGPKVGDRLPDFAVQTVDGHALSSTELTGHPALVNLWSPRCFACVGELPALQRVQDATGPRGLRVLGLFQRGGPRDGRLIADSQDLTFSLAHVGAGLMRRLGGSEVPTTLAVGSDGRIRAILNGVLTESQLRAVADSLP